MCWSVQNQVFYLTRIFVNLFFGGREILCFPNENSGWPCRRWNNNPRWKCIRHVSLYDCLISVTLIFGFLMTQNGRGRLCFEIVMSSPLTVTIKSDVDRVKLFRLTLRFFDDVLMASWFIFVRFRLRTFSMTRRNFQSLLYMLFFLFKVHVTFFQVGLFTGTKLSNRKSHMSFRLVPNSVTLDDLERRNSPNRRPISQNSVDLGADYVKVVEDIILPAAEMYAKDSSFGDISFMAILTEDHPQRER